MKTFTVETEVDKVRITSRFVVEEKEGKEVVVAKFESAPCRFRYTRRIPRKVALGRGLWVHPDYRRRGLGRALIDAACQEAQLLGCFAYSVNVDAMNMDAEAFYRAIGFAVVHEFDDGDLIFSKPLAVERELCADV